MAPRPFRRLAVLLPTLLLSGASQARPVVLELFTSQGCSSCPPAEALLGELASDADLLPLGFHVTYWNHLGWKDTASSQSATERQADYARRLGERSFTPQLVIDGCRSVVGSRRTEVAAAVSQAKAEIGSEVATTLSRRNDRIDVRLGSGVGSAQVILLGFDKSVRTPIARGENGGRTILQTNVVRSMRTLGMWSGKPLEFSEAPPAGQEVAVIVQRSDGRIVGAARLTPEL
ncbi:hypothetical protein SAMN04488125_11893 [Methylorubrum salsuginis]|uniref:DUF1223 domain-containing protein n=2 Tax=Methylorubrum salsuginis TaxID=414703 RepID=A0A1I4IX74_9HYPH|nr:hypothetical protein AX289_25520 [Methylorubrum populi]SFL58914.1 hypothetical protein SAMN04488125_11893 [Methylorubrum salsuginis]